MTILCAMCQSLVSSAKMITLQYKNVLQQILCLSCHCCLLRLVLLGIIRMANLVDDLQTVKLRNVSVSFFSSFIWLVYRFLITTIANEVQVDLICKRGWYLYTLIDHWITSLKMSPLDFSWNGSWTPSTTERKKSEYGRRKLPRKTDDILWKNSLHCLQAG